MSITRIALIVLDSVGCGALPNAAEFGDRGCDTLGHIAETQGGLNLPNMAAMGLGRIHPIGGVSALNNPSAAHG